MFENGALTGIKVIDISRMLPGPYCSMVLADHGARVIAVEDRRYQADNLFFPIVNRNKEHITLNLKTPEGQSIFQKLVQDADVLLEGFRPGVAQRLGVDYDTLKVRNPGLIYCAITGYGQTGPYQLRAGHDANYLAVAGLLNLIGEAGRTPTIPPLGLADIAGGSLNALLGILMALLVRQQTGQGQYIDISMTDGVLGFLSLPLHFYQQTGQVPERGAHLLAHRYACYHTYLTADDRYLCVAPLEHRFWQILCRHLGLEQYSDHQYDENMRRQIIEDVQAVIRQKPLAVWKEELDKLDVCCEPVSSLNEVLENPLFQTRNMITTQTDATGTPHTVTGIPVKLSATPGRLRTGPVAFGASTGSVLQELGYSPDEIQRLKTEGVI